MRTRSSRAAIAGAMLLLALTACGADRPSAAPASAAPAVASPSGDAPTSSGSPTVTAATADCWVVTSLDDLLTTRTDAVIVGEVIGATPRGDLADIDVRVDEVLWTDSAFAEQTLRFSDHPHAVGERLVLFAGAPRTDGAVAVWDLYEVRRDVLRGFDARGPEACLGRFFDGTPLGELRCTLASWVAPPPAPTTTTTTGIGPATTSPAIVP